MTKVAIAQMRIDAHLLMERALHALDCAGESRAAIHLDFAIEELGLRSPETRTAMIEAAVEPVAIMQMAKLASI
jgi:hypothetical protein